MKRGKPLRHVLRARLKFHQSLATTKQNLTISPNYWAKGGSESEGTIGKLAASEFEKPPNAVPTDTRVVVNTPAFRMDLFQDGKLLKSYKIGIGYPEFPLPHGLRKAQSIIFNPTWSILQIHRGLPK